ncbi:MAG: type II toxin-antitoxin system VapC family toxin [Anaerolineae bacterium]
MSTSLVCVDASIVVQLVTGGTHVAPIIDLWKGWHQAEALLVAPALLYYEVNNALRRYVVYGELLPDEAAQALEAALGLNIALYGDAALHRQALNLAERLSLPAAYDAHYLALSEKLNAEFWTADRRLVQVVQPALPWVHLVG